MRFIPAARDRVAQMERNHENFPFKAHLPFLQPPPAKSRFPVSLVHRLGHRAFGMGGADEAASSSGPAPGLVAGAAMSRAQKQSAHATAQPGVARQYAAVPWRMRGGFLEVMLVTSRRRGRWIVPKGWQVKGRTPSESAEREAFEEAGVIGRVGPEPIGTYRYSWPREDGSRMPRHVTVFGLHVLGTLVSWPEKGQRKRLWWSLDAACDVVGEPGLAEVLRSLGPQSGKAGQPAPTGAAGQDLRPLAPVSPKLRSAAAMRSLEAC